MQNLERLASRDKLTIDALTIWQAGVDAVRPQRLFEDRLVLQGTLLCVEDVVIDLANTRRLLVIGAGKASAAMAVAFHRTIIMQLPANLRHLQLGGWINAPAGTFSDADQKLLGSIHLHAARPAGKNEPTEAAVFGTQQILELIGNCNARDVVICLLSGGGSAVLAAPRPGLSLADKQAVAHEIAAAGGNIQQLNTVRRALSSVKGGGLARACRAGRLLTLVISDVLGDPLETIASGPTVVSASVDAPQALDVLQQLGLETNPKLTNVVRFLQRDATKLKAPEMVCSEVSHVILGNNADAVDAAGVKAVELGYRYVMQSASGPEGDVLELSKFASEAIEQLTTQGEIDCWISGGEPTVKLPSNGAGRGGRNQQLTLAILHELCPRGVPRQANGANSGRDYVFVSGGTDGEDGPTDAAGAYFNSQVLAQVELLQLEPELYLTRADAYSFFEQVGGLLKTGPTGTNVCDLRIALAEKP